MIRFADTREPVPYTAYDRANTPELEKAFLLAKQTGRAVEVVPDELGALEHYTEQLRLSNLHKEAR